jgi:hypothetical protein
VSHCAAARILTHNLQSIATTVGTETRHRRNCKGHCRQYHSEQWRRSTYLFEVPPLRTDAHQRLLRPRQLLLGHRLCVVLLLQHLVGQRLLLLLEEHHVLLLRQTTDAALRLFVTE